MIREHIKSGYPKASITRRNTGYAVDALMQTNVFEESKKILISQNYCVVQKVL